MDRRWMAVPLVAALALAGCATVPTAPAVTVLPGSQKSWQQFQADDGACRQLAYSSVGGQPNADAATNAAAANAVGAAALGAAAGAIIGSVTGQAGAGAAIGAGTGLLFGSGAAANSAGMSSYAMQRQYDSSYVQCMYAHGNQIPGRVAYSGQSHYAPASPAQNYPPPNYPPPGYGPPPSAGSYPPPDYPPPADVPQN